MTKLSDLIGKVRSAERGGDLIVAYDLAEQGLAKCPNNAELRYLATRALARSGATEQAAALYKRFRLDHQPELDIAALGARIAKDRALGASANRRAALRAAAAAYGQIFDRTVHHYPAINAATLYLLAGDCQLARAFACRALDATACCSVRSSVDRYYRWATRAEAALICRDTEMARQALQRAARHLSDNFDAAATTRRQLRLVCGTNDMNCDILDIIRPPAVLHYYGPTLVNFGPNHALNRKREKEIVNKLIDNLSQHKIGYAFGSLSAGSEILCAEACVQADVELHVVLPFKEDEFAKTNVLIAGSKWLRRFKACLHRAKSVMFATTDSYQDDDELFSYACRLAMGMTILRARQLDTTPLHFKLQTDGWDPDPAGYAANLRMWHAQNHASHLVAASDSSVTNRRAREASVQAKSMPPRFSRALIFGDVAGFSQIPDYLNPVFQQHFMGAIAAILRKYRRHVLYRNSWGDAIYIVMEDPAVAAQCCLAIQQAIIDMKQCRYGLPPDLALRLAAHFGPVYEGHDPVRDEPLFFGAHATFTARMEPVTPPGNVYVTEAMAAAIAMARAPRLQVAYVGNVPLAKNFGSTRMYLLKAKV
jgi:hypothetical protein